MQENITYEELLLDRSVIVNETDNMNVVTEKRNLTAETGNSQKHQQNRTKISEWRTFEFDFVNGGRVF